jgi:hypothetical protein
MTLNEGDETDGYWVHTIPGQISETTITYEIIAYDTSNNIDTYGPRDLNWSLRNSQLTLWPTEGYGDTTIYGIGFEPHSTIQVTFNDSDVITSPLVIKTDEEGDFTAVIDVSAYKDSPGDYSVKAVDELGNWDLTSFTVHAAPQGETGSTGDPGQSVPTGNIAGIFLIVFAISFLVSLILTKRGRKEKAEPATYQTKTL